MTSSIRRIAAGAFVAAALFVSGCATMAEGRKAPAVQGETWLQAKGDANTLTDGKWALVVFFRPEAPACADGMAQVLALQQKYAKRGLVVVGVTAADAETTKPFLKDLGLRFPTLVDAQHVVDAFGIPEVARNHTYLINPPGVVIAQSDYQSQEEILDRYLAPRSRQGSLQASR
jgi:peroxiredoxin